MAQGSSAQNNVYTVLLLVALLAVIGGIVFIWYTSSQLYPNTGLFSTGVSATVSHLLSHGHMLA